MLSFLLASIVPTFTICLDPGHSSENGRGAATSKLEEVELVWDVASRTKVLLEASESPKYKVIMTKSALEEKVTNKRRAEIANESKADLCLRIHADSGGRSGIATYYPYKSVKLQGHFGPPAEVIKRSRELVPTFHRAMVKSLDKALPDLGFMTEAKTFIGGKQGALTGTVFSDVPVFLVELCAVDNKHDATFALTEKGRDAFAAGLAAGIRACLSEGTLSRAAR